MGSYLAMVRKFFQLISFFKFIPSLLLKLVLPIFLILIFWSDMESRVTRSIDYMLLNIVTGWVLKKYLLMLNFMKVHSKLHESLNFSKKFSIQSISLILFRPCLPTSVFEI